MPARTARLERLLQLWQHFVAEVEQGYTMSIYEYTNDLSTRELIQLDLNRLREPIDDSFLALLQELDTRFLDATREVEHAFYGRLRIPNVLCGELEEDLRSEA